MSGLPEYVWGRTATLVSPDLEAGELRHLVMEASHRSAGYVYKDVFAVLDSYPFSLCQGDIAASLERLRGAEIMLAEATQNIKYLLDVGWPIDALVRGVAMWRDPPASTGLV